MLSFEKRFKFNLKTLHNFDDSSISQIKQDGLHDYSIDSPRNLRISDPLYDSVDKFCRRTGHVNNHVSHRTLNGSQFYRNSVIPVFCQNFAEHFCDCELEA